MKKHILWISVPEMESTEKLENIEDEKVNIENRLPTPSLSPTAIARNPKVASIREACQWRDIEKLRALATSEGGLVLDDVRRQAWPLLLGCTSSEAELHQQDEDAQTWRSLPKHRDEDQVQLDVDRSFIYYPHGTFGSLISRITRKADPFAQTNPLENLIDGRQSCPT